MSKLDDLLGKRKDALPVLDLSKTIIHNKEEYKRLFEKVPDYKMRPLKVSALNSSLKPSIQELSSHLSCARSGPMTSKSKLPRAISSCR